MIVRDWRDADLGLLQPLYERGRREWLSALGWDTERTLREVEYARTTWGLPGLLASDDTGSIRGWTFFLPADNTLHVGGLRADTPRATSSLLDALVEASASHCATAVSCFMLDEAPELAPELILRGFEVEPFLYLVKSQLPTSNDQRNAQSVDGWRADDVVAAASLLREAYAPEAGRHFAPRHTPAEWERYVRNLVEQTACGALNTDATRVVRANGRIEALVLATALSETTAHLAQVVVHPSRRGEGLARNLVDDACAIAAGQGSSQATLLVGASNTAARALYERLGFTERAQFVAARRDESVLGRCAPPQ